MWGVTTEPKGLRPTDDVDCCNCGGPATSNADMEEILLAYACAIAHLGYLSIRTKKAFSLISFDVFV